MIKDSYTQDTARDYDNNGFFEVCDNPISKSGVFQYLGKNIPLADDPTKFYNVYRPDEELNNPETINSFKLLPIIDDHEMLGKEATPAERKGVHGAIGQDIYFKDGILYSNLKFYSELIKSKIEGGKKELSCGFKNTWIKESGVAPSGEQYDFIQADIKGNHIALVDAGRMGKDVAVLDNEERKIMEKEELIKLIKEIISEMKTTDKYPEKEDEQTKDMDPNGEKKPSEDVEPSKKEDDKTTDMEPDEIKTMIRDIVKEYMGSKDEENKSEDKDPKAESKSEDSFDAAELTQKIKKEMREEFSAKQKLHDKLSVHTGSFDHGEMTLDAVAQYGIKKLNLTADKGSEIAMLNGYLAAANVSTGSHTVDSVDPTQSLTAKYLKKD